jgi:hypothetical protein
MTRDDDDMGCDILNDAGTEVTAMARDDDAMVCGAHNLLMYLRRVTVKSQEHYPL